MKKILSFIVAVALMMSMYITVNAQGTYNVVCYNCSGIGKTTAQEQVYGKCSKCNGKIYIHHYGYSKICFDCGSRNYKSVPATNFGNVITGAYDECRNCGSWYIQPGYKCTACNNGYCYTTVETDKTCIVCKGSGRITLQCTDHSYGDWTKGDADTHKRTCMICKTPETEEHSWGDWTITKNPSCTLEGEKECVCSVCQRTITDTIAVIDHDFEAAIVVKEPTTTTTGLKEAKCKHCNEIAQEVIPCLEQITTPEPTATSSIPIDNMTRYYIIITSAIIIGCIIIIIISLVKKKKKDAGKTE